MRIPMSAQTLLRLHRKLFMLRLPTNRTCSLAVDSHLGMPRVHLQWKRTRLSLLSIVFSAIALGLSVGRLIGAMMR